MYSKIINPETGRSVLINGQLGKNILRKYLKALEGGSTPDVVSQNREHVNESCSRCRDLSVDAVGLYGEATIKSTDVVDKIIADYKLKIACEVTCVDLNFENLVSDESGRMAPKKNAFYKCSAFDECNKKIKALMSLEYSHTGYYLNYLKECAYSKHKNSSAIVEFEFEEEFLVSLPNFNELCNWNEFKKYVFTPARTSFYIKQVESDDGSGIATPDTKSNNIFVVGPSAAGKTFSWKTLIPRLPTDYPSNYLSIDGGLMREYSLVYEMVKEIIRKKNLISPAVNAAIKNVVDTTKQFSIRNPRWEEGVVDTIHLENGYVAAVGGSKIEVIGESSIDIYDIFQRFGLKKEFNLIIEKSVKKGAKISLVIPDTLTGTLKNNALCKITPSNLLKRTFGECIRKNIVDKYNFGRIYGSTHLHPTVFLVYQHKAPINRVLKERRCEGTAESGNKRSIGEAKPYSSSAWKTSMDLGLKLFEAEDVKNGIRFIIHNSGSLNRASSYFNIVEPDGVAKASLLNIKELIEVPKIDILSGMLYTGKLPRREYILLN